MIPDKQALADINRLYDILEKKQMEILHALFHRIFDIEAGWYNGHFHKDEAGQWIRESFPIPVVTVRGLCDVEIGFDRITVTAKLKRDRALAYSFDKFTQYSFEAYGVEDYLNDFYTAGMTLRDMKEHIQESREKDIGFSFYFPFDTDGPTIFEFVKLIRREGFYY